MGEMLMWWEWMLSGFIGAAGALLTWECVGTLRRKVREVRRLRAKLKELRDG
jgi:hypothetical protein